MDQNVSIQHLIFVILFLKILFRAYNFFIFVHTLQWLLSECLFYSKFSSKESRSQERLAKKITHFTIQFRSKTSLLLRASTHFTLNIKCSRNTAKNLSHFTNFPANMFLFDARCHLHCTISWRPSTTAFLMHFESKCLYISVYLSKKIFFP